MLLLKNLTIYLDYYKMSIIYLTTLLAILPTWANKQCITSYDDQFYDFRNGIDFEDGDCYKFIINEHKCMPNGSIF